MKIVVTGAGSVMGQSIFRALDYLPRSYGLEIHFANSDALAAGRYFAPENCTLVAVPVVPLASSDEYLPVIERYVQENGIALVYPGTQHELGKLSVLRDRAGNVACLSERAAAVCLDKVATSLCLERNDVKIPKWQVFDEWIERPSLDGPVIIKPRSSSASRNVLRIPGRGVGDGLDRAKLQLAGKENNFIVQELLEGAEYTCGCYLDRYSKELSTIVLRRTLTEDGATLFGEVVENESVDEYVRKCAHALMGAGFDFGHINVQLMVTPDGPRAFEINGRLSSTERPKAALGFNSCAAFYHNLALREPYKFDRPVPGKKFIRYYEEIYF